MATEHEVVEDASGTTTAPTAPPATKPPLSRAALVTATVVGVLLVAWFFLAWLVLEQNVVDAAGESIGSAFAILVLVSLVGTFRRNRRQR